MSKVSKPIKLKILMIAIFGLCQTTLSASTIPDTKECYKQLTNNRVHDSRSEYINVDEFYYEDQPKVFYAVQAVNTIVAQLNCTTKKETLNLDKAVCKEIGKYGHVCYLEAASGYFYVVKDMMDGAQVVFNRYD